MPKRTIDEIKELVRNDSVDNPAVTILPSGEVVIDEEKRADNRALEALAAVRQKPTYY